MEYQQKVQLFIIAIMIVIAIVATIIRLSMYLDNKKIQVKQNAIDIESQMFWNCDHKFIRDYGYYQIYLTREGQWEFRYKIIDVFERANRKNKKYDITSRNDNWTIGMMFSDVINESMLQCKIDYLTKQLTK